MHVLFGTVLALNNEALTLIGLIAVVDAGRLAIFWRALVAECMDPLFLRSVSRLGTPVHFIFLGLVVLNLVGGFQALGTLLSVGLMMLPAVAARFWTARVEPMCGLAVADRLRLLRRRPAAVLSRLAAVRPVDHPVGRRDLHRLDAVRHARRRQHAAAPAPPPHRLNQPKEIAMLKSLRLASLMSVITFSRRFATAAPAEEPRRRRQLLHHRRLRKECRRRPHRADHASSGRTATRMSTSRARPTRSPWPRPMSCWSTACISKASCSAWSTPAAPRRASSN